MVCNFNNGNKIDNSPIEDKANSSSIKLTRIYIEPTSACNLSCQTCVRNTWEEKIGSMNMETFHAIIHNLKDFPNLERVALWGIGEPLMHKQIGSMIKQVKQLNVEAELITNAMLLTPEKAEELVHSGLDRMVVSIDSVSDAQFAEIRTGATLSNVLNNVKRLNQIKHIQGISTPEIGIEFTLMKKNMGELQHLKELASHLEASFIIVTNLLPYSEDQKDEILYWNSATEAHDKPRSKHNPEISIPRIDVRPEHTSNLGKLSFEALSYGSNPHVTQNYNGVCPFVEKGSIAFNWNGEASACVPLMHSYNCFVLGRKKKIVNHNYGNINTESLADIWNKDDFKIFRRKIMNNEFSPCIECGGCDMNQSNIEDCFGNLHPTCGDCLWAKGVIQCP